MKRVIACLVLLLAMSCSSQEKVTPQLVKASDNIGEVKDALVNYVIYSGKLEMENVQLKQNMAIANGFVEAISNVESVSQVDSVCAKYGVKRAKRNSR